MVNSRIEAAVGMMPMPGAAPVEWLVTDAPVGYVDAVAAMDSHVSAISSGAAAERVWLVEHPPLYTAGTSARAGDAAAAAAAAAFPIYATGRGGQVTYHGPGQRVAYVMLDLKRRTTDVRRYVATLEDWLIRTLASFNVCGERREDRIGVWVRRPDKGDGFEDKIAAIGIRLRRWVSLHGIALNVDCDLTHFSGIVPCGVSDRRYGVTSLADLGIPVSMAEVDMMLRKEFEPLFGPSVAAPPDFARLSRPVHDRTSVIS